KMTAPATRSRVAVTTEETTRRERSVTATRAAAKTAARIASRPPARGTSARSTNARAGAGKVRVLPVNPSKKAASAAAKNNGAPSTSVSIDVGASAPSFVLKDDAGNVVSSESLRGAPYVLYFYPKDDTPGCTREACGFRDALPRCTAKGVRVIGVSPDGTESHARFEKKYGLTFPLLSDPEKTLAKAYGVWVKKKNYGREYMGIERSTFLVDRTGKVRQVWRAVRVPGHVDTVLDGV